MTKVFYILTLVFILTNCVDYSENKVGTCCDKVYTNAVDAIKCLSQTSDGNRTTADERLLLIAFDQKDPEASQKLGWDILKDQDIIKAVKRKYALVILDAKQYNILTEECPSNITEKLKKNGDKTVFVIANQALCWFGDWTLDNDKDFIIERLGVGDGP